MERRKLLPFSERVWPRWPGEPDCANEKTAHRITHKTYQMQWEWRERVKSRNSEASWACHQSVCLSVCPSIKLIYSKSFTANTIPNLMGPITFRNLNFLLMKLCVNDSWQNQEPEAVKVFSYSSKLSIINNCLEFYVSSDK